MKMLIPQILDIIVVEWEGHKLKSIKKLRAALDKEFENEDNELSIISLKNVVKIMVEDRMKQVEILIPKR